MSLQFLSPIFEITCSGKNQCFQFLGIIITGGAGPPDGSVEISVELLDENGIPVGWIPRCLFPFPVL